MLVKLVLLQLLLLLKLLLLLLELLLERDMLRLLLRLLLRLRLQHAHREHHVSDSPRPLLYRLEELGGVGKRGRRRLGRRLRGKAGGHAQMVIPGLGGGGGGEPERSEGRLLRFVVIHFRVVSVQVRERERRWGLRRATGPPTFSVVLEERSQGEHSRCIGATGSRGGG